MQLVARVHHAVEQLAVLVRELAVDIQIADPLAVGKPGQIGIDLVDRGHDRQVVVSGKDGGGDDNRVGGLLLHHSQDGCETARDVLHLGIVAPGRHPGAHIVRSGEQDDDLRMDAVQFAVLQSPEDVLSGVCAPSEIGRVPAEKVLRPDHALFGLLQQLAVSGEGILVGSGGRPIGRTNLAGQVGRRHDREQRTE